MGKRKPSSVNGTANTGIYNRRPEFTFANLKTAWEKGLLKPLPSSEVLESQLEAASHNANYLLDQHRSGAWLSEYGDENETVRDAKAILSRVSRVRKMLTTGNYADALPWMYEIGRYAERLIVRSAERDAARGQKQAFRNGQIARARALTDSDLKDRFQAVQAELAAQAKRGDRISRERAYAAVANTLDLTPAAIKKCCLEYEGRAG